MGVANFLTFVLRAIGRAIGIVEPGQPEPVEQFPVSQDREFAQAQPVQVAPQPAQKLAAPIMVNALTMLTSSFTRPWPVALVITVGAAGGSVSTPNGAGPAGAGPVPARKRTFEDDETMKQMKSIINTNPTFKSMFQKLINFAILGNGIGSDDDAVIQNQPLFEFAKSAVADCELLDHVMRSINWRRQRTATAASNGAGAA
jgi:hypothetical protein